MDPAAAPRWHMPDETTLIVERRTDHGVLTSRYTWPEPPDRELVAQAVGESVTPGAVRQDGQSHDARRIRTRWGWSVYLHQAGGPPLWAVPRVLPRFSRGRYELAVGWLYRCYGICVRRDGQR